MPDRHASILASHRALLVALALGALTHYSLLSAKNAKAAALVACLAGGFEFLTRLLFPGNARRQLDTHRRLLARVALAATCGGSAYDLHDHLRVENTRDSWPLSLALKLTPALHNFFGSMHGGCLASAIDVATSIAIVADGGWPGVSVSLGVTYLAGCGAAEEVRLVPTVLRRGGTMAYAECKVRRMPDDAANPEAATLRARGGIGCVRGCNPTCEGCLRQSLPPYA